MNAKTCRVPSTPVSKFTRLACAAAIVGIPAAFTIATASSASPPSGLTFTPFTTASLDESIQFNHDEVKIQTKNATDVRMQKLDFAPGSYTGWHHHPGIVIFALQSGSVTFTNQDCGTLTFNAGQVFVEGHDSPHQASSSEGATAYVTYIVPDGANFRAEDEAPFCATSIDGLSKKPPAK